MKKAPDPVRGLPHFLAGSVHNQAEAVRYFLIVISSFARSQSSSFVTVFPAACLIEFVCAFADLVFEFEVLRLAYLGRRLFLRGDLDSWRETLLRANVRLNA